MIFKNKTLLIEVSVIAVFLIIKPLNTVLMNFTEMPKKP